MAFDLNASLGAMGQFLPSILSVGWQITQLILFLVALLYVFLLTSYNVRVMERRMTKGGRVIVKILRAKRVKDKKLGHPSLEFMSYKGFGGKKIPEPPADCIMPYQSTFGNTTLYDYIVKDGIYYPIANAILGRRYIVDTEGQKGKKATDLFADDIFKQWAVENGISVNTVGNPETYVYSLEGSGLEVTRDFDAEQSTLNNLINAADKYKNRKPIEIAAMYGLMIIIVVGSFITLMYIFYKTGTITQAINSGWELFGDMSKLITEQKLGPG